MREDLGRKLCKLAPHLFANRNGFFEVGDGWYKLLRKAAAKMEPLVVAAVAESPESYEFGYYRATQIKEKYGTLRFYLSSGTDKMYAIADAAERESAKVCEKCGKPGKLRGVEWVYTRCAACWKEIR